MKKRILKQFILAMTASSIVMSAHAVLPGFYMGVMGGPSTNDGSDVQVQLQGPPAGTTTATSSSSQFGSRAFMGYKMSKYAGIEGGVTYFSTVTYDPGSAQTCGGTNARVRDLGVVGKATLPLGNFFDVFGKAGVAVVYKSSSGAMNPNLSKECGSTQYENKFSPTVAVGASYDINQNWVADVSWTRLMSGSPTNNMDMYALGISYHFVDVYCGQFLC